MNGEQIACLKGVFEGLVQAGACMDSMPPSLTPNVDAELLEAVNESISRACGATERILKRHGALPEWAKRPPLEPVELKPEDLPF